MSGARPSDQVLVPTASSPQAVSTKGFDPSRMGDPDEVLTHDDRGPYLEKWHLRRFPDGSAMLLHRFLRSDGDDEVHDHPWDNETYVIEGGYWEVTPDAERWIGPGQKVRRCATDFHRVRLEPGVIPLTLFWHAPKSNEWGFRLPDGRKVGWEEFTADSGAYREFASAIKAATAGETPKDPRK